MARSTPYGAFNFTVNLNSGEDPESELGGFTDVSGLVTEFVMAEYRTGNSKVNHVRKIPGMHKVGDVTLKRGVVDSMAFFGWVKETRDRGFQAKRDVVITLRDETGKPVRVWKLQAVLPLKYTGPTLAAKGGGDVAMEEVVLSAEGIEAEMLA
jgi:phage tail-like protein